jgi:transglutaminase-like putative cysteine protease
MGVAYIGYRKGSPHKETFGYVLESALMIRDPLHYLHWTVNKIGTQTLAVFALLGIVYGSLIYGMSENVRDLKTSLLLPFAVVGLIFGWLLARSKITGRPAAILAIITGIALIFLRLGGLISPLLTTIQAFSLFIRDTLARQVDFSPISLAISELGVASFALLDRLYNWAWGTISGNPSFDAVPITIFWSLVIWFLAVWSSWAVRRLQHPLLGVVPTGILLAVTINYVRGNTMILLPMIGGALLLIALLNHSRQVGYWQSRDIDYSEDIQIDFYMVTGFLTMAILSFAFLLPSISIRQIAHLAARFSPLDTEVDDTIAESFGIRSGYSSVENLNSMNTVGLPRRHLIGSGPELSEEIIMLVKPTISPSPELNASLIEVIPRFYWRSLTYDRYIGSGWASSPSETVTYSANEWIFDPPDFVENYETSPQVLVRQRIQGVENLGGFLYTAGKLATADADFRISWRIISGENKSKPPAESADLFGALIESNAYQATSLVNAISEDQLRASQARYPDWIRDRYLELPAEVPERVISLAHQITASQSIPYDRAKAIETYLRDYPYTLDLPEPPSERDIVDYFLFDLQRGYCDYYASSMVVLARAAGLPARLAIGFASGIYDPESAQYVVSAADAHSWPEIYFSEIGWVEFEPTAGQSSLERPVDLSTLDIPTFTEELNALPGESHKMLIPPWPIWLIGIGIFIFIGFSVWFLTDNFRLRHLPPRKSIARIYQRFYRLSQRLTIPSRRGDTPYQYAAALKQHIKETTKGKKWERYFNPTSEEATQLTDIYTIAEYSPHPPEVNDQGRAIHAWQHLRWRLWIARWLRK